MDANPIAVHIVRNDTYDALAVSDIAIVASGTATLETALLDVPMVIIYRVSALTYYLAKVAVRIEHLGLVNILAGRTVVPELLQKEATGEKIAAEILDMLTNRGRMDAMKTEYVSDQDHAGRKRRRGQGGQTRFGNGRRIIPALCFIAARNVRSVVLPPLNTDYNQPGWKQTMDMFKRLLLLAKPHTPKFIIAMLCMMGVGGLTATQAYLVKTGPGRHFCQQGLRSAEMAVPGDFCVVRVQRRFQLRSHDPDELHRPPHHRRPAQSTLSEDTGTIPHVFHQESHRRPDVPDHQRCRVRPGSRFRSRNQPHEGFLYPGRPHFCHLLPIVETGPDRTGRLPPDHLPHRHLRAEDEKHRHAHPGNGWGA